MSTIPLAISLAAIAIVAAVCAWALRPAKCPRCNTRRTVPCRDPQKQFCLECMQPFVPGEKEES